MNVAHDHYLLCFDNQLYFRSAYFSLRIIWLRKRKSPHVSFRRRCEEFLIWISLLLSNSQEISLRLTLHLEKWYQHFLQWIWQSLFHNGRITKIICNSSLLESSLIRSILFFSVFDISNFSNNSFLIDRIRTCTWDYLLFEFDFQSEISIHFAPCIDISIGRRNCIWLASSLSSITLTLENLEVSKEIFGEKWVQMKSNWGQRLGFQKEIL